MVLGDSIQENIPNSDFQIILADKKQNIPENLSFPHSYILIETIATDICEIMHHKFNQNEFILNLKPVVAEYLLTKYNSIIYIDCQSVIYQNFNSFDAILADANIVLCPQLLNAGKHPSEKESLNSGIFHAGFFGLRNSEETRRFLGWWKQNCLQKGFINLCKGLNAEQLWLEHVPAMFEKVKIVKHPGINLGKWNLAERNIHELKADNQIITINYNQSKYPKDYIKNLNKYYFQKLKNISPAYGILLKKTKKTEQISQKIRNLNRYVDIILDKIVELFIEKK